MGIDTNVLLRVRDRKALRAAFDAHAAAERKRWADEGSEAEYDEIHAGRDTAPLLWPLEGGAVSIFTGLRFQDRDMEFSIRCWLFDYFGDRLVDIHDDPRGVFVFPDICEPRAKTYEGVIDEVARDGRFIDPTPPTAEEHADRERQIDEYMKGMEAVEAAQVSGDPAELQAALDAAPDAVRETWQARADMAAQLARMEGVAADGRRTPLFVIQGGRTDGEVNDAGDITASDADGLPSPEQLAFATSALRQLMGEPEDENDAPVDEAGLMEMFETFMGREMTAQAADPLGHGRVSMLLPPAIAKLTLNALDGNAVRLDIQERLDLADGSLVLVTSRLGENVMEAMSLAELLAEAGVDRSTMGPLPFFRESLLDEIAGAPTFDEARVIIGERAEMLALRTTEEWLAHEKSKVASWLREEG